MQTPQLLPVSTLQRSYATIVKRLPIGPVFLSQHSKPVAVVLAPTDYDRLISAEVELHRLQRMATADQDFAEMRNGKYVEA